jgi:hypothetical protein
MENRHSKMCSFEKLTQFSKGNNVLNASASNLDGFLWRDTCVSSIQQNSSISNNMSLFPPWIQWLAWSIHLNNLLSFSLKQCARCYCFSHTGFLLRDMCVSWTSRYSPIGQKRAYHHFGKPRYQEVFLSETNSILTAKQYARFCSS